MSNELPDGVRQVPEVPAPAVRWAIQTGMGHTFDGYVFDDDQSDLGKFFCWLATQPFGQSVQMHLIINRFTR